MTTKETVFSKDLPNKKIIVERAFNASLEQVWEAWTNSEILDQWWAPKPYRAETRSMDFREGGLWLYRMAGPEDDGSWCKEAFDIIDFHHLIANTVAFCDEEGNDTPGFPVMSWNKEFNRTGEGTTVTIEITFEKLADLEQITGMGFQEGFTAGLNNLDEYLDAH